MTAQPLPMFPLGTVLVPGAGLPLHIFEPRYRAMTKDCLAGDGCFGVVLIERGSEVGGHDVRSDIGTRARIAESAELTDGRWALVAAGEARIRVRRWLDDDPYPRAEVEEWPDPEPGPDYADDLATTVALLRRALALTAESGQAAAPATVELADDPLMAGYQALALAPIPTFDRHRLLAAPTPDARAAALAELLRDRIELIESGWQS